MGGKSIFLVLILMSISFVLKATDLDHTVSGGNVVEDVLGSSKSSGNSPYLIEGDPLTNVENSKANGEDYIFNHGVKEVTDKVTKKKQYRDSGYTLPGTFENQENYLETDKLAMVKDFRSHTNNTFNLTFIKNDYEYQSSNDIINRTIGEGYRSIKGGALYLRYDTYITKTKLLNAHWSVGAGLGYNSGRGIFVDGTRSDARFNLWEIPFDAGLGMEVPLHRWFKVAGTFGPSLMGLIQNRSDLSKGEDGKRKIQYSPGYFVNAQLKINISGFDEESAYKLFTSSEIANMFMNLEVRHQNYENFQDTIAISGTSFGVGFTFEYL